MQPQDPYQYQKPDNNLPPVQQSSNALWSPVGGSPLTPVPDPRAKRMKLMMIAFGVLAGLLLIAVVVAATSGNQGATKQQDYVAGPETDVPLTDQEVDKFTMRYPSSLALLENVELPEEDGWYLLLSEEDVEASPYNVSVKVSTEELEYADGEEAVFELNPSESDPYNIQVSDVVTAGVPTKKTTAEYMQDGVAKVVAYSASKVGNRNVEVIAQYPKDNEDINRSFDAMIGSIKLK